MRLITPRLNDLTQLTQMADLLVAAFRDHWPQAWPDQAAGLDEARECLNPEWICRAAAADDGQLLGWISGRPEYAGHVWELHPLVVHPAYQRRGLGRALVREFEAQVRARGALTIFLGTDDEDAMTSLAGVDLYHDLFGHLAAIRNRRGHPFEFYQKLGFQLVGVVPDANGRGRPDLLMAKRVDGDAA